MWCLFGECESDDEEEPPAEPYKPPLPAPKHHDVRSFGSAVCAAA